MIGRPLKSVVIVDNLPKNFILQPENGVYIKPFQGEAEDTALKKLIPIFKAILQIPLLDIREILVELKNYLASV